MDSIKVNVSKPYDVLIGEGILDNISELSNPIISGKRALVVSGSNVAELYAREIAGKLCSEMFVFEAGEENKSFATLEKLVSFMADIGMNRDDVLVSVGGGVTGDLCGLAASLYMRGIRYIQIPTTLLAMVDASVGGKTAVNITQGKNLIGSFYQPSLVVVDPVCLRTLPERIYAEGMAEVIKCSYIKGEDFTTSDDMIKKCIELKKSLVEEDEFDTGARRLLNFGHTIGHAIETLSGFSYLHGEAVAAGMAYMCRVFASDYSLMEKMLLSYGLPVETDIPSEDIVRQTRLDKKGGVFVVPHSFGDVRVEEIDLCKLT